MYLVLSYKKQIRAILAYGVYATKFQRKCIVYAHWSANVYHLDLGLAYHYLCKAMVAKRVCEVFTLCSPQFAWFYKAMQYFKSSD